MPKRSRRSNAAKIGTSLFVTALFMLTALPGVIAPEVRSYPPNTVTVTTGTPTGTVDDLYSYDDVVYSVLEEDVGVSSLHTATEEWIVDGTLDSGVFPDDTQTEDDTGVVYIEVDDDNGALTGDSWLLTPTGAGTWTEWTDAPGPTNWQMVDDDPPHDVNATYITTGAVGSWTTDTYATEDLAVMPVGAKESGTVTIFAWGLDVAFNGNTNNTVYTHSTLYNEGVLFGLTRGYTNDTWVMATNPNTGLEWTLAEINAMEIGIAGGNLDGAPGEVRVTSVGAVIPLQDINYALDVRHNITAVPAGRENYLLTMRALTDPGEDITVSVYDHVAPGWDVAFTFTTNAYATETFALTEADHVNAGEIWLRYTDAAGDAVVIDGFDIDLLNVRAYNVEYTLDVSFGWVGLEGQRDPRLSVVGYKSDAELITLQVLRSGAWVALDANIFIAGVTTSWSYNLSPVDVEGGALQVRFVDNDITDNAGTTIYLDMLTVRVEKSEDAPAAPIDVFVDVSYDLWANEIILRVTWVQTGGPEPALERGKWATIWVDGVEVGTYTVGNGSKRVAAPWSWFDGNDHNITAIGAVNVDWPTWQGWQTYFSDPEIEFVSNFPRFAVQMFGLLCALAVIAIVAVRAIKEKRKEDEK